MCSNSLIIVSLYKIHIKPKSQKPFAKSLLFSSPYQHDHQLSNQTQKMQIS
jgi:hypothetical protein